jgi:hypothetical protein
METNEDATLPLIDQNLTAELTESDQPGSATPHLEAFAWQASEYLHHEKNAMWYIVFFGVVVFSVGVAGFFHYWITMVLIAAMAAAIYIYASRPPRILSYSLDEHGVTIEGKFYPYDNFRSFAVIEDIGWHAIDLEPTQRFMPRLTILFDTNDFQPIVNVLQGSLPEVDRKPDWVERLTRYLKF